jgi:hypothetical protein
MEHPLSSTIYLLVFLPLYFGVPFCSMLHVACWRFPHCLDNQLTDGSSDASCALLPRASCSRWDKVNW